MTPRPLQLSAPVTYSAIDLNPVPDEDKETICRGCARLTCQVSNQPVYITFGYGTPPAYGQPEPYLPFMGQLLREFDAVKVRAYTPAASLPAGTSQAAAKLIPLTT